MLKYPPLAPLGWGYVAHDFTVTKQRQLGNVQSYLKGQHLEKNATI